MRIRWRDLELPTRVVADKKTLADDFSEFSIEPFERGFGHTIGNSLRRILLSSIEGCAVTSIKIDGVKHEFSTIDGVFEDVSDIILHVKKLRLRLLGDEDNAVLYAERTDKGTVTGGDLKTDVPVEVVNKDLVLATLSEDTNFRIELEVKRGRGYVTAEENLQEPQEIGVIPIASIFSPVVHVQYRVENTRVGKVTNYDRLVLRVRTDGTITPEMALVEAGKILRKHLNPFVQYFELGQELQDTDEDEEISSENEKNDKEVLEKLEMPIESLELSVRASNCLASEGVRTIYDLVKKDESDMLKIRNFGKTSLNEIKEKLADLNLSLGMQVDYLKS